MIFSLKQLINHMFMFNQIYFILYICLLSFDLLVMMAINTHEQSDGNGEVKKYSSNFKVEKQRKEGDVDSLQLTKLIHCAWNSWRVCWVLQIVQRVINGIIVIMFLLSFNGNLTANGMCYPKLHDKILFKIIL